MNVIKNGVVENFETILKKILEYFQNNEHEKNIKVMFNNINLINEVRIELDEYEKTINSRTRPLRLGFVGSFSTGKSSMINSLIGEEILGVKLEPATAQITELSYGEKFEILEATKDEDSNLDYKEVSLKNYQKNSTSRGNKSTNLSHYIIKHPSKNLSKFTIVDTPGFSSTSKEDDELTKEWIETLDLLIWIFDANKVGDKTEYHKLKELGNNTKVIGVINKIDTKSPNVREKIRNEILNEDFLDEVYFYSSKKVIDEFKKSESFNDTLENITSEIKYCVNNSESFEINNSSSEITFKTTTNTKPFNLTPIKKTTYTEYYDVLINQIDKVRNNEISLILNQNLVNEHNEFRNYLKEELLEYQDVFNKEVKLYAKDEKEDTDLLQKSEKLYKNQINDFDNKLDASFKVFYTSFFDELGDILFFKHIEKGVFSDDIYICGIDRNDQEVNKKLYDYIHNEFHHFLKSTFDIYEGTINNSVFKEFSEIKKIRNDEYHLINSIVQGLVVSSTESIQGYQRNFESYKTENFSEDKKFHKNNIDLVIPDELLKDSINTLLIYDLIDAKYRYVSSLEDKIRESRSRKNDTLKILNMIEKLLEKIN